MPEAAGLHLAAALDGAGWHPARGREPGARPADRFTALFVGSPATVAQGLRVLQDATGADEVLVTTITHDHAGRVRSFELVAQEWGPR